MPKQKTHSGAKKRFRAKKSGLIKRGKACKRHILTSKRPKRKGRLSVGAYVFKGEAKTIRRLLGA